MVDHFSISINGRAIKHVNEFKYLGVVFDNRLSWNAQIKEIIACKARKHVGMLGHVHKHKLLLFIALTQFTSL